MGINLNDPTIPLIGAKPDPAPTLDDSVTHTMVVQTRTVEALWTQMQLVPYGSPHWTEFARRFAIHVLGLQSTGLIRQALRTDAEAQENPSP